MGLAQKKRHEYTAAELIAQLKTLHIAGTDLRHLVELTQEAISEDYERRVKALKSSRDGIGLPVEVLGRELVRGECRCVAALRWTQHD